MPRLEDGYLLIPQAPGLGVELGEGAQDTYPYRPVLLDTRLHVDGSVVDQ